MKQHRQLARHGNNGPLPGILTSSRRNGHTVAAQITIRSKVIAGLIPSGYGIERVYMPGVDPASTHQQSLTAINNGAAFVNFIGHGAPMGIGLEWTESWEMQWLLSAEDVPTLTNGAHLPVFTMMTCTAGDFGAPGQVGVSEALVLNATAGASAVWGPTGYSLNRYARLLDRGFYTAVFAGDVPRMGDAVIAAAVDAQANGNRQWMQEIYNLLGDPAMVIVK